MKFIQTKAFLIIFLVSISSYSASVLSQDVNCELWLHAARMNQNEQEINFRNCLQLAEEGELGPMYQLSIMFNGGIGTESDQQKSIFWEDKAAEQWHAEQQIEIAARYCRGTPRREQNLNKCAYFYELAAKNNSAFAQDVLGGLYQYGTGVVMNFVIAHMWFNIASSNGHPQAASSRNFIERNMTIHQIAEAQSLALRCVNSNYTDCGY